MTMSSNNNAKLAQFSNQKYVNLETYRKNGQSVQTPVWFVIDNVQIYIRTYGNSGKINRAKKNPRVRIIHVMLVDTQREDGLMADEEGQ